MTERDQRAVVPSFKSSLFGDLEIELKEIFE